MYLTGLLVVGLAWHWWRLSTGVVGFRVGKGWLCWLGLVLLGVRWGCRGGAVLELLTELADLEAQLSCRGAGASTVDWLVRWGGRRWSGGSAGVGLEGSTGVVVGNWLGWWRFHGRLPSYAWRD